MPVGIPGMGKTFFFSNFLNKLINENTPNPIINFISQDDIRSLKIDEYLKKHKDASPENAHANTNKISK